MRIRLRDFQVWVNIMAENVNDEEEFEEEEEEQQGADAQQTLDDLTVLNETGDRLDDADTQTEGDDALEWQEPSASQSLSSIHTGSRPTDDEIMANLVPEGESITASEEIGVIEEDPEAELPDVEPPAVAPDAERSPDPQADFTREDTPPPAPDDAPVEVPPTPVAEEAPAAAATPPEEATAAAAPAPRRFTAAASP